MLAVDLYPVSIYTVQFTVINSMQTAAKVTKKTQNAQIFELQHLHLARYLSD